jgi:ParB family chromosome partitioning protein
MATETAISDDLNEHFIPDLRVDIIYPDPNNPRKFYDKAAIDELAASILAHGIVQPIVVRPHPKLKSTYMIVAGERRYRAVKQLKKPEMPAIIRHYTEQAAAEVQQIENLQRADVHPLDEAHGFKRLIEHFKYTPIGIAEKIGKSVGYVVRRMKLVDLIDALQKDFWEGKLPIGHAEYLCRFARHDQELICSGGERDLYEYEGEIVSLRQLKYDVERTLFMDLDTAPWKKDEPGPGSAPACTVCPHRSGNAALLFPELEKNPNTCTYRDCFDLKLTAHIDTQLIEHPELLLISPVYGEKEAGVLKPGSYHVIRDKKDKCKSQQSALYKNGRDAGHVVEVCIDKKCPKHVGQIYRNTSVPSEAEAAKQREHRAGNVARQAVFHALFEKGTAKKFSMEDLQDLADWAWERAWQRDKLAKAFGWERVKGEYSSSFHPAAKAYVKKASEGQLIRFIMLMAFNDEIDAGYNGARNFTKLDDLGKYWKVDSRKIYNDTRKEVLDRAAKHGKKKAVKK